MRADEIQRPSPKSQAKPASDSSIDGSGSWRDCCANSLRILVCPQHAKLLLPTLLDLGPMPKQMPVPRASRQAGIVKGRAVHAGPVIADAVDELDPRFVNAAGGPPCDKTRAARFAPKNLSAPDAPAGRADHGGPKRPANDPLQPPQLQKGSAVPAR